MCGVRISNPSPNHMGTWKVFTNELRNGQQMISNNKELSLYTYNQVVIKSNSIQKCLKNKLVAKY